jgi:hypothetical protein
MRSRAHAARPSPCVSSRGPHPSPLALSRREREFSGTMEPRGCSMRLFFFSCLALLSVLGCSASHPGDERDSGRTGMDTGVHDGGDDDAHVGVDTGSTDDGGGVVCGGAVCGADQECCASTLTCTPIACDSCCRPSTDPCAGVTCASGTSCCSLDGICHPTACLSCCMERPDAGPPTDSGPPPRTCVGIACPGGTECCPSTMACVPIGCGSCCPDAVDAGPAPGCATTGCAAGLVCCAETGSCYDSRCLSCCMPRPSP